MFFHCVGVMNNEDYNYVRIFLVTKKVPANIRQTKSNFIALSKKYKINQKGFLTREGKIVVKKFHEEKIFREFHKHSGRNACWEKIKQR